MSTTIPSLDRRLSTDCSDDEVKELIHHVRPNWDKDEMKIEVLKSAGFVNTILCCYLREDTFKKDALLIRLNAKDRIYVFHPELERVTLQMAQQVCITPRVHALFNGGFVQQFIHNKQMTYMELFEDSNCRQLATAIARLHSKKDEHSGLTDEIHSKPSLLRWLRLIFTRLMTDAHSKDESQQIALQSNITKDILLQEFDLLEKHLDDSGMRIVLSHNDIQILNILKEENTGKLYLIDYELSRINYDSYDFTYLMGMIPIFQLLGIQPSDETPEDDDYRKLIRHYLEEMAVLRGGKACDIKESDTEAFLQRTHYLLPVFHFFVLVMMNVELEYDHLKLKREHIIREIDLVKKLYKEQRHLILGEDGVI